MGKVVSFEQVIIGINQHTRIPDSIGFVAGERGFSNMLQHDTSASPVLPPTKFRVVKVVRKVAVLDRPAFCVAHDEAGFPAFGVDVPERHM